MPGRRGGSLSPFGSDIGRSPARVKCDLYSVQLQATATTTRVSGSGQGEALRTDRPGFAQQGAPPKAGRLKIGRKSAESAELNRPPPMYADDPVPDAEFLTHFSALTLARPSAAAKASMLALMPA